MKYVTMWKGPFRNLGRIRGGRGERTQLTGLMMGAGVARTGSLRMRVGREGEAPEEEASFAGTTEGRIEAEER